jgi:hypothetical protein
VNAKHLTIGGGLGVLIAGVVAVVTKHHVHLTTDESVLYGGVALAAGTGLAHRIEKYGLKGLFTGLWNGQKASPVPPAA